MDGRVGIEREGHWRVVWLDGKQIGRIRKRDNSAWYLQVGDEFVVYPHLRDAVRLLVERCEDGEL